MSQYTWFVFLQNSKLVLNPDKLKIPYSCKFIIIQPETRLSYKLIEYYTTTNKFFINDFAMWNYRYGFKSTNVSVYWRKLDLNRTRITALMVDYVNGPEEVSKVFVSELFLRI